MPTFLSAAPQVVLTKAFPSPFKNVIATARTCYSSKGVIDDATVDLERFTPLARSIYEAGHHTTYQHAQFQFALSNISRQFIWSFLHAHPFYNSEQVSQRYVAVKPDAVAVPPLAGQALEIYTATITAQHQAYRTLIDLLQSPTAAAYMQRFPFRAKYADRYAKDITKKAQEIARYVLPVATFAYMYHTVSGVTLLRYWRVCEQFDTPVETRIVVRAMVDALLELDPNYAVILQDPLALEDSAEYRLLAEAHGRNDAAAFAGEFDAEMDGRTSRLVDCSRNAERTLADAVRGVLGFPRSAMTDDDAIDAVLNPARNTLLGETLVLTTHDKLSRALVHPHYTFAKKLSHAADSQDQRHRMTPGSRPVLHAHLTRDPDFVMPDIIRHEPRAEALYTEIMNNTWDAIGALRRLGVGDEFAMYLLPNATAIRFMESSDLLNLHHKHAMRLCYNAQEEIWRASLDEALQIRDVHPRIGTYLLPPCTLRDMAGVRPICPEGDRFCGEKVWRLDIGDYERVI